MGFEISRYRAFVRRFGTGVADSVQGLANSYAVRIGNAKRPILLVFTSKDA